MNEITAILCIFAAIFALRMAFKLTKQYKAHRWYVMPTKSKLLKTYIVDTTYESEL